MTDCNNARWKLEIIYCGCFIPHFQVGNFNTDVNLDNRNVIIVSFVIIVYDTVNRGFK